MAIDQVEVLAELLKLHAQALASVENAVQATVLALAGIFSYFRFIHGRTLVCRARVEVSVTVCSASHAENLHAVKVLVTNIGAITIWRPSLEITARFFAADGVLHEDDTWQQVEMTEATEAANEFIDSGETVTFLYVRYVPLTAVAVEYEAWVRDDTQFDWTGATLAPNKLTEDIQTKSAGRSMK